MPTLAIDWPLPDGVSAAISCKSPLSMGYGDANLAQHVGDDPDRVSMNRQALSSMLSVEHWQWLHQVHGTEVAVVTQPQSAPITADAITTRTKGLACPVLTADCLPVLLAAKDASQVAAVHAGWRGLAAGILEGAVSAFGRKALTALLGPAIGPASFEVGAEVKAAFVSHLGEQASGAFIDNADRPMHYFADLYALARIELGRLGVSEIYGGKWDTLTDTQFYSFRREAVTGRMVSAIWLR